MRTGSARNPSKRGSPSTLDHQGSNASESTQVVLPGCSFKASTTATGGDAEDRALTRQGRSAGQATNRRWTSPTQTRQLRSSDSRDREPQSKTPPSSKSLVRGAKRQKLNVAASPKAVCTRRASSPKDAQADLARQGKPLQVRHLKPATWSQGPMMSML